MLTLAVLAIFLYEKFKDNINITNQLAGIITADVVQDHRKVSAMIDIINIIKQNETSENKLYQFLGRVLEISEAKQGYFFIVHQRKIMSRYTRKMFSKGWETCNCNEAFINDEIKFQKGKSFIDWDEVFDYDTMKGMPDWKSVVVVPVINNGMVVAIVSLSVSAKIKEFTNDDLNYIGTLAQLSVGIELGNM